MTMVLDFFVKRYLDKLFDFIEGKIGKVLGVKEEIVRFYIKLSDISQYIEVAEKRRHKDNAINIWVKEINDIMYDAEDIIDFCTVEWGRLEPQPCASSGVCSSVSLLSSCIQCSKFRIDISDKIKKVNERLDQIREVRTIVPNLEEHYFEDKSVRTLYTTTSTHVKEDIVGTQIIDAAAQKLISEIELSEQKCIVLGISGMGGIGKTTLAQKIFNHEMVKEQFSERVWLHVSKDHCQIELLKQLLRGLRGNDNGVQSKEEVEGRLAPLLSGNLLLVLDDIWSASAWTDSFRKLILNGSCRSAILFTTRNEDVAREMEASIVHPAEKIDHDSGWELIRKNVFGDREDAIISELKDVGMKIVKKCDGLPQAIIVMAKVLFHKRTKREWEKVTESDLWSTKNLSNALYLSYEDLPIHLKRCFLSCAFYNAISSRDDIIRLWVAEGFVIEQSKSLMEDIAEKYYEELIARNFLQMDHKSVDDRVLFVMHNVLRSFGEKLMKDEGIINNDSQCTSRKTRTKIRRFSTSSKDDELLLLDVIKQHKCLRAVHLDTCPRIEDHVFESLKHLRVLDLSGTSIDNLPNSLTKLLHLKYLDLGRTKIRNLPKSIGRLANLQTLNLLRCESLHELPKGITRLSNLRCLQIESTPLTHVPKGVGNLKNLNHLSGFLVGHCDSMSKMDGGCDLDELQYLLNLRYLQINKLERATRTGNINSVLANKTFLRSLILGWTINNNENNEQINEAERICSQLSPPPTLQSLRITNFPGRQFPKWIVSTSVFDSLADLTALYLVNFPSCRVLLPLGQLPKLKILHIEGGEAIKSIGPEFLGCRMLAFPKLEYLEFSNMPNWEAWVLDEAQDVVEPNKDVHAKKLNLFPNLQECNIVHCPKLKNSILPSNRYLQINLCPNLEYVEKVGMLQQFRIVFPSEMQQLPKWASNLINATLHSLQTFSMECNSLLLDSCSKGKQNWHIIRQIPKVTIDSIDRETRLLLNKDPYKYEIKDKFGSVITLDQSSIHG